MGGAGGLVMFPLTSLVVVGPVAVLTGQTEKAVEAGCAVVCIPAARYLVEMDSVSLALFSSRFC